MATTLREALERMLTTYAGRDVPLELLRSLLAAHPVEPEDKFRNVPPGLYRNSLGAELHVTRTAMPMDGVNTLAGDIAFAADRDELFGTTYHLVTLHSLERCGYELIDAVQS